MMRLSLGISPIAWMNDDLPEISVDLPLEVCLAEARKAGYTGVESGRRFPDKPEVLGPILADAGLALASGWYSGEMLSGDLAREKDRIASQLEMFRALGAPVIVYGETFGSVQGERATAMNQRPVLDEDQFRTYGRNMTALAEHCVENGVPLSFHHHVGTAVEDLRDVDRLMSCTGEAVGLLHDAGHMLLGGGDPIELALLHGFRINHFHAKDVRADVLAKIERDTWSFLDAVLAGVFTVPGDGCIDFNAICNILSKFGYTGWAVVEAEQDPAMAPPAKYAGMGREELYRVARKAGYQIAE